MEKLIELVGFSSAGMLSNKITLKRANLKVYTSVQTEPRTSAINLYGLVPQYSFGFPLNLRGFITDVAPNEKGLDFDLYL
jgi:hypothetical protein